MPARRLLHTLAIALALAGCGPAESSNPTGFVVVTDPAAVCTTDDDCRISTDCCGKRFVAHRNENPPALCKLGCAQSSQQPNAVCGTREGTRICDGRFPLDP